MDRIEHVCDVRVEAGILGGDNSYRSGGTGQGGDNHKGCIKKAIRKIYLFIS